MQLHDNKDAKADRAGCRDFDYSCANEAYAEVFNLLEVRAASSAYARAPLTTGVGAPGTAPPCSVLCDLHGRLGCSAWQSDVHCGGRVCSSDAVRQ